MKIYRASIGYYDCDADNQKYFFNKDDAEIFLKRQILNYNEEEKNSLWQQISEIEVYGPTLAKLSATNKQLLSEINSLNEREMNLDDIADYQDCFNKQKKEIERLKFNASITYYTILMIVFYFIMTTGIFTTIFTLNSFPVDH